MGNKADRFIIYEGSKSSHCCFEATVMDSTRPVIIGGKQHEFQGIKHYETVCECFSMEDAEIVCRALNADESEESCS